MKIAFVGASGYGNVGDDTYPLIFRQQLRGHELVFYNSDLPAHLPEDIGLLVIGGGGVVYNVSPSPEQPESPHFCCMKFYMDAAIARGIPWGILSCGFQFRTIYDATSAGWLAPWVPYLQKARFITFRSRSCVRICQELSGREDARFFPDAAYLYRPSPRVCAAPLDRVTLVPAGEAKPRNALVAHHLRQLAASGLSISCLSMGAEVDDGRLLAQAAELFPEAEILRPSGPAEAFEHIARSRFVISGRYHGMVFARTSRVPFITPVDVPYKLRVEDYSVDTAAAAGHFEVLDAFLRG